MNQLLERLKNLGKGGDLQLKALNILCRVLDVVEIFHITGGYFRLTGLPR
jgi:hypothetical protein